ncbi:S41 family peptidase [Myxococcota bacterium]|nr:S41 family peptidase [Myxococcota bacterium]
MPEPFPEVLAAAGSEQGGGSSGSAFSATSDGATEGDEYRISALTVFSNVALHVKDNYVNPERINPKEMLKAALFEVERQVPEVLVEDMGQGRLKVRVLGHEKVVYTDDVESLWEINLKLREVFRFFEKHLPSQKDPRSIEYAAVNGALSTLDPHSVLMKPDAFQEMKTSTKGEFGGLGIVISVRDAKLTIMSPLDGTPASRAGLLTGDVISRIGEVSTVSMAVEEAVELLRGPEGSKVTIWVDRKGWPEAKRFVLTRERIKIESVEGSLLSQNVGYIKIKNFQQNTGKDLEDKLGALSAQAGGKLKGLVLDLRNNPGGLLEQAIRVSDKFLTSGDIVTTVGYGNKLREPKKARWSGTESELPIAVLVNNGSASASEIVAGALKNLDRAVTIGERSFGKGSVQVLYDFADNSALKLTIAQYLTPGGVSIQNVGITPDIELKSAWIEETGVRLFYEPESHREDNLEKHLDRNSESAGGAVDAAAMGSVTYLLEKEAPPAEDEEEAPPTPQNKVEEDFSVRFARDFLVQSGAASRATMLKSAPSFIESRGKSEAKRIADKIGTLGVDWAATPPGTKADPTTKLDVELKFSEGASGDRVDAGAQVKLLATVKNQGPSTLHRLRGMLDSEHPAFKGREFLFGKLAPGESRSWTITTKISKEAASRSDLVKLKLDTDEGPRAEEAALPVVTKSVPHPLFGYNFVIDDSKRGDGDGVLEAGEGVDLTVFVTNAGRGDADEVVVRLKSAAGEDLFLERGRADVGKIKAGETATGKLRFKVRKNQTPGRGGLPVELTIYDSGTGEWMEDQFSLVVDEKRHVIGDGATPQAKRQATATLVKKSTGVVTKGDTTIFAAAADTSEVIATVEKNVKLPASARLGDFHRVDLGDEIYGWVRAEDVRTTARPKAGPITKGLTYQAARRLPSVFVDSELGESVVDGDRVTLSGAVSGRSMRDMYVLLNDKKVHFAAGPSVDAPEGAEPTAKPAGWSVPNEQAVVMPFKVDLPLKDGLNRVLVVARLDEKLVTYRTLFVTRRASTTAPVVAEATKGALPEKKTPPKTN